jgi:hypoxanthine-guanine phosphoribosyltransferase
MDKITLLDKSFKIFITHDQILEAIGRMAGQMIRELEKDDFLFICVLNGSFILRPICSRALPFRNPKLLFLSFHHTKAPIQPGK